MSGEESNSASDGTGAGGLRARMAALEEAVRAAGPASRVLDVVRSILLCLDPDGRITYINAYGAGILGYEPRDLQGRDWFAVCLSPEHRDATRGVLRQLIAGDPSQGEFHENLVLTRTGESRTIAWHNVPMRDAHGRVTGSLSSGEDVTDRRRTEAEHRHLQEQLLQAQKLEAIGKLAGGVAHDFNNLLMAIKGYAQIVLASLDPHDPRHADIREIETAANRAAALTRQLLLFSHRERPRLEVIDINALIGSLERMLRRLIGEDARLVTICAPIPCCVLADPGQIEQVIMNLVLNARDAMPDGGRITVRVEHLILGSEHLGSGAPLLRHGTSYAMETGHPCVRITVEDTGTGIRPEHLDLLFEPFFTTKRPGQGTGLGLSVVYGIVQEHGGAIAVSTRPGAGSAFAVYLPEAATQAPEAETPKGLRAEAEGGERILVVEDEESVRRLSARALQDHGYAVIEAASLAEARRVLDAEADRLSLVFSDMVLPDGTGLDLRRLAADTYPALPFLLTSGYTDARRHATAASRMGLDLLPKPYDLSDLLARVRKALDDRPAAPGGRPGSE